MANKTSSLSDALAARLIEGALPGEIEGLTAAERAEAAAFVAQTAASRPPGTPAIALEMVEGDGHRRRMRLAVVNDDMPFLVDSIAATIAAHDVPIDRVIHPVVLAKRDAAGTLLAIGGGSFESMVYIEMHRADAKVRRAIESELARNLAHVRSAVADWPALQAAMRSDASKLVGEGNIEGGTLLQWFNDRAMTLLGHESWYRDGRRENALGIARHDFDVPLLAERSRETAIAFFEKGGAAPLLLKSNCIATVHRRVPLDLVLLPVHEGGKVTGLSLHAGLWTSGALHASPRDVPVLRERLAMMEAKFGFDPKGHTGKALTHALTALPHDLTAAFQPDQLERLALTAMSLADRPRPKLEMVKS
ncbi:MAG TPA: glutamate dehydrogenase, partial [Sphingomonas sp.]|nr:glutamate dehydrogenase [Sphingomonas sp.]